MVDLSRVPGPGLPAGRDGAPASESACGQGLRTGAHLRCFPSHRCAAGPSRSRSHGRLRRPKSLPIRHSPAAAPCLTPFVCRDIQGKGSGAAVIANSGAEIGNRCKECPGLALLRAVILDFKPRLKNRCKVYPGNILLRASILDFRAKLANRCKVFPVYALLRASILDFRLRLENQCKVFPV